MACSTHSGCMREFRISRKQRDIILDRAFHLDVHSANAPVQGQYPYRWEVRRSNVVVCHWSNLEQYWFVLSEDDGEQLAGVLVHIIVMLVQAGKLIPSIDLRKHVQAQDVFTGELLRLAKIKYTVVQNDVEQDRTLLRAAMDEGDVPESWKPNH